MQLEAEVQHSIAAGLEFLAGSQLPSGEFPIFTSKRRDMAGEVHLDPSVFPTTLVVHALRFVAGASTLRERGKQFLRDQKASNGPWRHWTRDHPHFEMLPPDLDDTSCASAVMNENGLDEGADRDVLLANRTRHGLFYTWIIPRLRWTPPQHRRIVLAQLRSAHVLYAFFKSTSAAPDDVDAVVNANCVFALGEFPGRNKVIGYLLATLREGKELICDKWYDDPFVIWYFFSRALNGVAPEARALIEAGLSRTPPANALQAALAAASLLYWGALPTREAIADLVGQQTASGGWPRAGFYHGGRARRADGSFAEQHPDTPHWGSEALTTAICLQVLAQWHAADRR